MTTTRDEIDAIRARYEDDARDGVSPGSAFWQGHLDVGTLLRALDEAQARAQRAEEALKPFAKVGERISSEIADDRHASMHVSFTQEEAIAFNQQIDEREMPIKKAITDPFAKDAGMNWPSHNISLDGIDVGDLRRAAQTLKDRNDG